MQVERGFPMAFAPGRWTATVDGRMPVKLVWVYWHALQMGTAADALATAQGIGLALGDGHEADRARDTVLAAAIPTERMR